MAHHYSDSRRETNPHALPDVEVFERTKADEAAYLRSPSVRMGASLEGIAWQAGWYWQACFPGCLPDGDPVGPFDTEAAALEDAREGVCEGDDDEPPTPSPTPTTVRCAVCGEEAPTRSSMAGIVHRWGPRDHDFTPAGGEGGDDAV